MPCGRLWPAVVLGPPRRCHGCWSSTSAGVNSRPSSRRCARSRISPAADVRALRDRPSVSSWPRWRPEDARSATRKRWSVPSATRSCGRCPTCRWTTPRLRTPCCVRWASPALPAAITWSWPAHGSTWSVVRACRGRALPTCVASSCCSSSGWSASSWKSSWSRALRRVVPPVLVREPALYGTGFLPDTEQQLYRLPDDDLYLVGTSEVALASLHRDEILAAEQLPLRYAGFSTCFRREAGAAGKDTRGIFRVHQFDKVEMFSFVAPEESAGEHERVLGIEESILQDLEIPYRVVAIAVDDLGASAAKKYDCEAWLPGQGRFRELTSCSNTTDYQARRLDIRYRRGDARPAHLHTLNGTAVAVGRTIIALLENGQRPDGSVVIPAPLHGYGVPPVLAAAAG